MVNLKISDHELDRTLKSKADQDRVLTKEILLYIGEVIRRKLYLKFDCSSIHAYLTKRIGYSEAAAQSRLDGARILLKVPDASLAIEDGRLHLTQMARVEKVFRQVKKQSGKKVELQKQREILVKLQNKSAKQTDLILAQELDIKIETPIKRMIQQDESERITITFSKDEIKLIENVQALLSNKTGGGLKETFIEMARVVLKQALPKVRSTATSVSASGNEMANRSLASASIDVVVNGSSVNGPANQTVILTSAAEVNVHGCAVKDLEPNALKPKVLKSITPRLKKEIRLRDQVCQFINPHTKKPCGSKFFLEVDHIQPRYLNGPNTKENLRLLCRNHNLYRYENGL